MREPKIAGDPKDLRKLRVQGGLSAGELDAPARHWPVQERLEHPGNQFRIEEIVVPRAGGLGKTHGTLEIAAIRDVDDSQAWLVVAASVATRLGRQYCRLLGIRKDQLVPFIQFPVQSRVGEDQGFGGFMAGTLGPLIDLAVSIDDF
jgi:hypothetical protein